MRIYISVDIEGVCDVVNTDHLSNKGFLYNSAREQMTLEVNAAIEGALEAGANSIVVNDSHGCMLNIIPKLLHKKAQLITGPKKPLVMMQGIEEGFDACMFIGYHARNNTPGVLSHSIDGGAVDNIYINDKVVGETEFNALLAGAYNTPVIMVTGDNILSAEVNESLGDKVTTVTVKQAISRYSAKCLHPDLACQNIKEAAYYAVLSKSNIEPYRVKGPYIAKLQFRNSGFADNASRLFGSTRVSGDTVSFKSDNILEALKSVTTMIALSK